MDDLAEIKEIEDTLIQIWGSQDQAYSDLEALISDYDRNLFDSKLPPLSVAIMPRWMLSGPLGGGGNAAANYNPSSSGSTATIYLGRLAIVSKVGAAIIVAHEMIHHWEETTATESETTEYSAEIDDFIAQIHSETKHNRWRAAHSARFIAKANGIAVQKRWNVAQLLMGKKG